MKTPVNPTHTKRFGGQAMTEYVIVVAFVAVFLILSSLDPSPIQELLDAIKSFYSAYSYAISISA